MAQAISTGTFGVAKILVSPDATQGTHTTLTSAMASASSGDTIFVRDGTYTENFTLTPGVNISALGADSSQGGTGSVTIIGTITMTGAGTCTLQGLELQTNGSFLISVTGASASRLELTNCYLNCSNNVGINYTSSSPSSYISLLGCNGDTGNTTTALYNSSSAGTLYIYYTNITNSGNCTTTSTNSSGLVNYRYSFMAHPISNSSTGITNFNFTNIDTAATNSTAFSTTGTGASNITNMVANTGTATAISVGTGTTLAFKNSTTTTSNAVAISVSGTLVPWSAQGITSPTTPTSVSGGIAPGGIGEQITSFVSNVSAVPLTPSNTSTNVTSINLTPGVWDVSALGMLTGTVTSTRFQMDINTVSATPGTNGNNSTQTPVVPTPGVSDVPLVIPQYRIALSTTTTVYLIMSCVFSVGTPSGYGRISATRVG